jgi:hypothetical protein
MSSVKDLEQRIEDLEELLERAENDLDEAEGRARKAEARLGVIARSQDRVSWSVVERIRRAADLADVEPYASAFRYESHAYVRTLLEAIDALVALP